MPYVKRDASGRIIALLQAPEENAQELLPADHPDIQIFLGGIVPQIEGGSASAELSESDLALIRVIEDIVDMLIEKNVIMFTDLPQEAREKILLRKSTRKRITTPLDIVEDEDKIF
jgi:hypothetical protein